MAQATGFVRGRTNRRPQSQELATANDSLVRDPLWWPDVRQGDDVSGCPTARATCSRRAVGARVRVTTPDGRTFIGRSTAAAATPASAAPTSTSDWQGGRAEGLLMVANIASGLFFATAAVCLVRGAFLWSLHFIEKAKAQQRRQQQVVEFMSLLAEPAVAREIR